MVANSIQNLPAFVDSGQHSIVTAPADTGPSPRMRNLTLRGSGSTSFLPAPVVALSCNRLRTLIIARVTFPTPRLHNRNDCRNALNENLNVLGDVPASTTAGATSDRIVGGITRDSLRICAVHGRSLPTD